MPYDSQPDTFPPEGLVEQGYKECVGNLTEGRYLVFSTGNGGNSTGDDQDEYILAHRAASPSAKMRNESQITVAKSTNDTMRYSKPEFRWILHYYNNNATDIETTSTNQESPYLLSNSDRSRWLGAKGKLVKSRADAAPVDIKFDPGTKSHGDRGYSVQYAGAEKGDGGYIVVNDTGKVSVGKAGAQMRFRIYSVTYSG